MEGIILAQSSGSFIETPHQTLATTDLITHHALRGNSFGVAFNHKIGASGASSVLFENPANSGKHACFYFMDLFLGSEAAANIRFRFWHNPTTNLPTSAVNSVVKNTVWTATNDNNTSTLVVKDQPDGSALGGGTNYLSVWVNQRVRRMVAGFPILVLMPGSSFGIYGEGSLDQVLAYTIQWWEHPV